MTHWPFSLLFLVSYLKSRKSILYLLLTEWWIFIAWAGLLWTAEPSCQSTAHSWKSVGQHENKEDLFHFQTNCASFFSNKRSRTLQCKARMGCMKKKKNNHLSQNTCNPLKPKLTMLLFLVTLSFSFNRVTMRKWQPALRPGWTNVFWLMDLPVLVRLMVYFFYTSSCTHVPRLKKKPQPQCLKK